MVRYRDKRIKTESGHGHHGPARDAESCGMIGGDGINGESNKTAPAPKHHKSSYRPQHPFTSYLDNPAGPHRQGTDTMERALEARAQRLSSPSPTAGQAREHNNENASYTLNETGPRIFICQCKKKLEMAVLFEKSLRSGSVSAKISRKQGLFREIVAQEIHRNVCHLTSTMSEIHQ